MKEALIGETQSLLQHALEAAVFPSSDTDGADDSDDENSAEAASPATPAVARKRPAAARSDSPKGKGKKAKTPEKLTLGAGGTQSRVVVVCWFGN